MIKISVLPEREGDSDKTKQPKPNFFKLPTRMQCRPVKLSILMDYGAFFSIILLSSSSPSYSLWTLFAPCLTVPERAGLQTMDHN